MNFKLGPLMGLEPKETIKNTTTSVTWLLFNWQTRNCFLGIQRDPVDYVINQLYGQHVTSMQLTTSHHVRKLEHTNFFLVKPGQKITSSNAEMEICAFAEVLFQTWGVKVFLRNKVNISSEKSRAFWRSCLFIMSHRRLEWVYTLRLPEYQGTPCSKQPW